MDQDEELDFTDDEILDELSKLGYTNVPDHRLKEFKKDLKALIRHEYSKDSSANTSTNSRDALDHGLSNGKHIQERIESKETAYILSSKTKRINGHNNVDTGLDPALRQVTPAYIDGHASLYENTTDQSRVQRDDISEADSERRMVKRKVLRRRDDGSKVIDESMSESDIGSMLDINERLRDLGIDQGRGSRRPQSACDPPYRLSPDDPRPASVILRPVNPQQSINLRKSDPVARYQQFRQSWSQQKAPGEKSHKNLRWNIREQMLAQDEILEKKAQKVYVPNTYKVPTEKKRTNLRWQIRMDIAQGHMPPHGFYHEY